MINGTSKSTNMTNPEQIHEHDTYNVGTTEEVAQARLAALEAELQGYIAEGERIRRQKLTRLRRFLGLPVPRWDEANDKALALHESIQVAKTVLHYTTELKTDSKQEDSV